MTAGLGRRVHRLEEARRPGKEAMRLLVRFVASDDSERIMKPSRDGTWRPATEAEIAGEGAGFTAIFSEQEWGML